eukprot:1159755-Pelagomonas_calceolata.AAC.5
MADAVHQRFNSLVVHMTIAAAAQRDMAELPYLTNHWSFHSFTMVLILYKDFKSPRSPNLVQWVIKYGGFVVKK